jgi:NADPH-dependent glutamate synthase beta subunit-like oxidoreductase/NAD-dependent dihydropyrimidine dehydrogenase PreA subunit
VHVITQNCCNDATCVSACPVNCIHPTPDEADYGTTEMLHIDPDMCIDCGACIEACPVQAIVPDYELNEKQKPFIDINALWFRDSAHRGYSTDPAARAVRNLAGSAAAPLHVAVVGSGPAGCYAVEELLAQHGLNVEINVFERLPVPGGLVRYGVAPDHHRTKTIADHFALNLRRPGLSLFLNVEVGTDISHEELKRHHHAVIYANGAPAEKALGIPGEQLAGSHSATSFVAWYNGHPDFASCSFDFSSERAVVVGNGNVALDVARILTTEVSQLRHTDIATHALDQLAESRVTGVRVARNALVLEAGAIRARGTDESELLPYGLVLRAVGYRGRRLAGLPFDAGRGVVPNQAGRVVEDQHDVADQRSGVYVVGWAKRVPSGVIGTNRTCARETVAALVKDHVEQLLPPPTADPQSLPKLLAGSRVVTLAGWKAIDDHERALGRAQSRSRVTLVSVDHMLSVADGTSASVA